MKALTIAVALVAALTFARADSARAQLDASMNRISAAMKSKNLAALDKEMRATSLRTFKYTEGGQSQNLDTMLKNMKTGLSSMDKLSVCTTKVLSLKEKGNSAVGLMEHKMVGTMKGEDKKTHTLAFTGVSENTYVKQNGQWKLATMKWKTQKQTMDGKPMSAGG